MRSTDDLRRTTRFMQNHGRMRPGYLNHTTTNLDGPVVTNPERRPTAPRPGEVRVKMTLEVDPTSGELRFVPRTKTTS